MRIGFSSIYSWRPHVEHLYFLATLARRAGHETRFLTCEGDLPTCYTRELRDRAAWSECLACRFGNIRTFSSQGVSSIGQYREARANGAPVPEDWAYSSASTLGRFESDADYQSEEFHSIAARLQPAVELTYRAARAWIERERLDAVCFFNGRMDATRAIYEAARAAGIRSISLERTWFGDGVQLLPDENCLGLKKSMDRLIAAWKDQPLRKEQGLRAASHVAARFLRRNAAREYRAYNTNARAAAWPVSSARRRILLIPGSRNEIWSHPDWAWQWPDAMSAYDALIAHLGLQPEDLVLRCHPNWGEKIGKHDGRLSEEHYSAWARRKGITCIASTDNASTLGLIEQSDAIVVANGSAAMEAGLLGKQIIGIAPSVYEAAGIRDSACTPEELRAVRLNVDLDAAGQRARAEHIARRTLRFCYTMMYRIPQYTRYVKAERTTRFRYDFSASPDRFMQLIESGTLQPDDAEFAADTSGEDAVLQLIAARNWSTLGAQPDAVAEPHLRPLHRRLMYRPVDVISRVKPIGDR